MARTLAIHGAKSYDNSGMMVGELVVHLADEAVYNDSGVQTQIFGAPPSAPTVSPAPSAHPTDQPIVNPNAGAGGSLLGELFEVGKGARPHDEKADQGTGAPMTTGGTSAYSREISFVDGAIVSLHYPQGSQQKILITEIKPGLMAFGPFQIGAGKAGRGEIDLVEAFTGQIDADFAIGTEAGVFMGPSVLFVQLNSGAATGTPFQVMWNTPGYGPELPTDTGLYINLRFHAGNGPSAFLDVAAHDRMK